MKRGALLLISLAALLLFTGTSFLIADEAIENLDSVVIENFDDPDAREWAVVGSKFITEGMPLVAYAPAWPEAVFGRNRDNLDLKVLGVQASFDRTGYNYLEFIPVEEDQSGELQSAPITLPGRVKTLDQKNWWEKPARSYQPMHPAWGETAIQRRHLNGGGEVVCRVSKIRPFSHGLGRTRKFLGRF